MDRANAIRLLRALVSAGASSKTPMANAWLHNIALRDLSLHCTDLASALAYAGNEGWLKDGPRKDSTSLTRAGEIAAKLHS